MNRLLMVGALGLALVAGGCGYHVSGRGEALPKNIKTIAIPSIKNLTTQYHLADRLAADISREFITRTRYQVITDPSAADAVLSGIITKFEAGAMTYDPTNGRASVAAVAATVSLTLTDRTTGKVLYTRTVRAHDEYEISPTSHKYFEESGVAVERISRRLARDTVTAILETF